MEGVPIRAARRGDIPSLMLLWEQMMKENAAIDPRLELHPRAREQFASQLQTWLQDPNHLVVVAEEGGRLVIGYAAGSIVASQNWEADTRLGEVSDCFVVAPRRRRGIARRLVGRILDQLFEKGVSQMRLQAAARNEGAVAFWRSIGWEVSEEIFEKDVDPPTENA